MRSCKPEESDTMNVQPLRVICFGDSITGARPRQAYRHSYLKFADLLQLMLEARLGIRNAEVLNRGFAGQTSEEARARLQADLLDEKPHLAVVLIGGNDRAQPSLPTAQTRANLHEILSRAKETASGVLALQYHFLPAAVRSNSGQKPWSWLVENNELIAHVAAELEVPTLAMQSFFDAAATQVPRGELVDDEDGVHLRPGGEMIYARAIFSRFDELGWIQNPQ
jgi:lysophospholipase L1-like esterase